VSPNGCEFSVCNLLHVIFLAPRILRWRLDFLKICAPLSVFNVYAILSYYSSEYESYILQNCQNVIFHTTLTLIVASLFLHITWLFFNNKSLYVVG